jgi:hypothetical protein
MEIKEEKAQRKIMKKIKKNFSLSLKEISISTEIICLLE